ncbi:hypothetical protein ACIK7D_24495 [Agrobacterium sp. P15N1-A]
MTQDTSRRTSTGLIDGPDPEVIFAFGYHITTPLSHLDEDLAKLRAQEHSNADCLAAI